MKEYAGKRILIVVENLPLPFDRRVWQEANALKDKGAEVFIICPKSDNYPESFEEINGIKIYRHSLWLEAEKKWEYFLEYISALFFEFVLTLWIFFKHGLDVIHACNPPDLIFLVALSFKFLGTKFIFDHHDINPELYLAKDNSKDIFYKMLVTAEKLTFWLADISIATNKSYKEVAVKRGNMDPDKVFIVRSGPDLNRLKILEPKDKYKNGKDYLVGYVGVIGQQEGLKYLVDAVDYVVNEKNRRNIQFTCIGDGPYLHKVKKYARKKDVQNFLNFTGRLPDKEMLEILNTADICVNPDEYNEMNDKSTMNKIMEYMALGKPIVQFDLKEGRYSAREASLYANPNDSVNLARKILELIDAPEKRENMGKQGLNRVKQKLIWDKEKENLYEAYNYLLYKN